MNMQVDVYDMIWVKPIDSVILEKVARNYDAVVTVEDGTVKGDSALPSLIGSMITDIAFT